jgi:cytochrome c-type biogenesis protein CcmH
MPRADRTAMIRGMVDGLASRLERAPHDADGWIRLIRSRVVLGEGELAKQALARGLAAFAEDGPERGRIAAAAQELGVSP